MQRSRQQNFVNHDYKTRFKAVGKTTRNFSYDYVFGPQITQEEFFKQIGMPEMIERILKGFNSTVFAYGPTGSGKTYTMQGEIGNGIKVVNLNFDWFLDEEEECGVDSKNY